MRAARLIKMVLLLQSRPAMTAAELAAELEVSERTVARDAQALSEAGIPVYSERGRAGGYRLVGGYRTGLTGLARTEAEALFLSGVPGALRDMGLGDAASAARLKVSAALLPSLRDAPHTAAQRFHLDAPAWFREPETPRWLPAVAQAVWEDRRIRVGYRAGAGRGDAGGGGGGRGDKAVGGTAERELEPYGLVLKAGVWYLCARMPGGTSEPAESAQSAEYAEPAAPGADAPFRSWRVYRVDRFTEVAPLPQLFERSEEFDLPAFWAERSAEFTRSLLRARVELRLTPKGIRLLPHLADPVAARDALAAAPGPDEDGWTTVSLPVESEDVAYDQLLGLGPEAEVLAPAGLRTRFAEAARELTELYAPRRAARGRAHDGQQPG